MEPTDHDNNILKAPCFSSIITNEQRDALIRAIWPTEGHVDNSSFHYFEAYFQHMNQECHPMLEMGHAAQNFTDLIQILNILRADLSSTGSQIRAKIKELNPMLGANETKLCKSTELVVKLWLTIDDMEYQPFGSSIPPRLLPDDFTLAQTIQQLIDRPSAALMPSPNAISPHGGNFPESLTVVNLEEIGGFRILWTNNLLDHLKLDGSIILLYRHAAVLYRLRHCALP